MSLRSFHCLLALLPLLAWSRPAQAGPVEQLTEVAFGPDAARTAIVTRYENGGGGLIFGAVGSRSWQLQCGSAYLGAGDSSRGPLLVLADGTLLLASSRGVVVGSLDGCGHQLETPLADARVIELVADPSEPNGAIALCSKSGAQTASSSLWRRSAAGQWTVMGSAADPALATGVRARLRQGRLRLYETALVPVQDEDAGARYFLNQLRYSDDGGQTFQGRTLVVDGPPRIVGVDPRDPERLAILIERSPGPQRIVVTADGGATLSPYLELEALGGITFAADGRVWIGARTDRGDTAAGGIWTAPSLAEPPVRLPMSDYTVQCLGYHAASHQLYACQHFWLGLVDPKSGAYDTQLSLARVEDFVGCDGSAARCEAQLCADYCGSGHFAVAPVCSAYDAPSCGKPVAQQERGGAAELDAGTPGRDAAVTVTKGSAPSAGGGCSAVGHPATHVLAWLALVAAPFVRRTRRRSRS